MLPTEVSHKLIDLGICYQFQIEQKGFSDLLSAMAGGKKEDFSELGYNNEKEQDEGIEDGDGTKIKGKVIIEKEELLKYDGWHLALKPPKEFPKKFSGQHYSVYMKNRRLIITGNDVPWTANVIKHSFALEYVKDIKLHNNILLIFTDFGQTGIVLN